MYEVLYYDVDYTWILVLIVSNYDKLYYFTIASIVYSLWTAYKLYMNFLDWMFLIVY